MSDGDRDDPLVARTREHLEREADALDDDTRLRLRAVRLRALDALDGRPAFGGRRAALGAMAAAGAGAIGIALARRARTRAPAVDVAFADGPDDVEILGSADDLELYDDLDFYRWLDENEPI